MTIHPLVAPGPHPRFATCPPESAGRSDEQVDGQPAGRSASGPELAGRLSRLTECALGADLHTVRSRAPRTDRVPPPRVTTTSETPMTHDPASVGPGPDLGSLLAQLLGEDGLRGDAGVTHADLVDAVTGVIRQVLDFDECWFQEAGAFSDAVARWSAGTLGVWTANPGSMDLRGARSSIGAMGGVPVRSGDTLAGCLLVWSRGPRAWTTVDRRMLRRAGEELSAALTATAETQTTLAERAGAEFAELRRELIVMLNHELRTPLTTLSGGLELLEDETLGVLGDGQRRLVERMGHSVRRLQELADNVSRVGALPVDPDRWDLGAVPAVDVADVIGLCLAGLDHRGQEHEVVLDVGPGPVEVDVPADELRELLDRILSNAVKFTPDGGRIAVAAGPWAAGLVQVSIADSGPGVTDEETEHLGTPFFRSAGARRAEKQGAGLGLAAARSIAEAWGGHLDVESDARGTRVSIVLPARRRTG